MLLTYQNETGGILSAVYDADIFKSPTIAGTVDLYTCAVDEILPDNKELCRDIINTLHCIDAEGDGKYKIIDGVLYTKENWEAVSHDL